MKDSDSVWRKWGEIDPYFGVFTDDKFRKEHVGSNHEVFFESGAEHINVRLQKIEKYFGVVKRGRALDFGCGVGRLVLPLAGLFNSAVGIDISPAMLEEARSNAEKQGLSNVEFALSDDRLSNAIGEFDLVHTFIVLQHIPVRRGMTIIRQLLDRVALGGGISLHFPIDRRDSKSQAFRYWAQLNVPGVSELTNVARGRKWREPMMQMNKYSLSRIVQLMREMGFREVVIDLEDHLRIVTANVLAKRAS